MSWTEVINSLKQRVETYYVSPCISFISKFSYGSPCNFRPKLNSRTVNKEEFANNFLKIRKSVTQKVIQKCTVESESHRACVLMETTKFSHNCPLSFLSFLCLYFLLFFFFSGTNSGAWREYETIEPKRAR